MSDDPYDILGVDPDASQAELRDAYRRLALEYHPDHNPDDAAAEERFREISRAYRRVETPEKRRKLERRGPGLGGLGDGAFDVERGVETLGRAAVAFGEFVRDRAFGDQGVDGADLEASLEVQLEELVDGTMEVVRVPARLECETCDGTGLPPGSEGSTCPKCDGRGRVGHRLFGESELCDRCDGTGETAPRACGACGGSGRRQGRRAVEVRVPPGTVDGERLRLPGSGAPGRHGGDAGDLLVEVEVVVPTGLERDGGDVRSTVEVSAEEAALGGEVRVETLEGDVDVEVPPGTSAGDVLRLAGRGLPTGDGRRGDHYVQVKLARPDLSAPEDEEPDAGGLRRRLQRWVGRALG